MSLTQTLSSVGNPLSGVKRPLSKPSSIPNQPTAFRGIPNEPGKPIKAPKLSNGNRTDRGTNVTVPCARITPLTSIAIQSGRLSPGDVCFLRRKPVGFSSSTRTGQYGAHVGTGQQMSHMLGLDGLNRLLSGTLGGSRSFKLGDNLIDESASGQIGWTTDLFDAGFKDEISILFDYRLDGVIMSNEEPGSFSTTEERDAAIFNIAVRGPAATNNGFLAYETHSAVELYSRGSDPMAYVETLRIGSERALETWNSKVGYDFVSAYTGVYTEFPLQMFSRDVQILDRAYLLLRKYNLLDDVIVPRAKILMSRSKKTLTLNQAELKVLESLKVENKDGSRALPTLGDAQKHVFFQYMPCSSQDFAQYLATLKQIDKALVEDGTLGAEDILNVKHGRAAEAAVQTLTVERFKKFEQLKGENAIVTKQMDSKQIDYFDSWWGPH